MCTPNGATSILEKEDIKTIFLGFAVEAQKQMTEDIHLPKKKVIVLAGPTGVGKTDFAIELAKEINGEIISGDSMQVYQGMDIGTAKATAIQQKEVPHHLIDIRRLNDTFSVVDFFYEARHLCQEIHRREAVPIIVGGSGFYLHSLIYGPPSGPPAVPEVRKSLQEELDHLGVDVMYERLRKLDPKYASTITKHDKQKIIRGLEIISVTGKEVSKHSWSSKKRQQNFEFLCWFLYRPKEILYQRIEARCDQMIKEGFIQEVERLKSEGLLENSSASQAIGYRQALEYLDSERTASDFELFVQNFKQASRKYAKRQFTWFRGEPLFRWLDVDMHDPEIARDMVRQDFESRL